MRKFLLHLLVAASLSSFGEPGTVVGKKYIAWGFEFDNLTPEVLLKNAEALDASGLDGIGFTVHAEAPFDTRMGTVHMFDGPLWKRACFEEQAAGYRKAFQHKSLRHCFLQTMRVPYKHVDWTDDAAWNHVASNLTVAAWFAKSAGFEGLSLDFEDYHNSKQFLRMSSELPYDELVQIVRRRGAELFRGVFREFPEAVILSFWLLSMSADASGADLVGSARDRGDLWPAFCNGMLDVAPRTAKFVDGDENAYDYDAERGDFWRAAVEQKTMRLPLVASRNRLKYKALHSTSFGAYLDNYVNDEKNHHYIPPLAGSRLRRFVQNLNQATEAADEYVWFWNEKDCWVSWDKDKWLPKVTRRRTYEEILPGITEMMRLLRNRGRLPDDLPQNLVNMDSVGSWSDGKIKGTFARNGDVLSATGSELGGYSARMESVVPGDVYGVHVRIAGSKGNASVSWKSGGKWRNPGVMIASGPVDADGWRTAEAVVVVPPGIDTLVLAMNAKGLGRQETVQFRDVAIYRFGCD